MSKRKEKKGDEMFDDTDVFGYTKQNPNNSERSIVNNPVLPRAPSFRNPDIKSVSAPPVEVETVRKHRVDPRTIKASADFHTMEQPSILASEAPSQDFRGLYNLAGLALIAMNARLVVENLYKYGWLMKFNTNIFDHWDRTWPSLVCLVVICGVSPTLAHLIEVMAYKTKLGLRPVAYLHVVHTLAVFLVPIFVIHYTMATLVPGLMLLAVELVVTMKLISYAHVCNDVRRDVANANSSKKTDGPDNNSSAPTVAPHNHPSLQHIFYFMGVPTLCFQLSYPRSPKIRWRFVVRRLGEVVFCLVMQIFLAEQYVMPTIKNSLTLLDKEDHKREWGRLLERVLKLAVPNACIWLLMFYALFHSYLNLCGELLRFGDRLFYRDWWNAQSLDVYWRNWNLPVHNWIVRHIYAPAQRHGLTGIQAQALSFFASAVLHEVLVSVPCHTFKLWAFWGMMGQVPLIILTRFVAKKLNQPVWGNLVFWASFLVFGQPLLILLYAHDYIRQQGLSM